MLLHTYFFIRLGISFFDQLQYKLRTITGCLKTQKSVHYNTPLKFVLQANLLITINHLMLKIKE
jgi:hypothetical protein